MTCNCENSGWCETFKRTMGPRMHDICRGEVLTPEKCAIYRETWEKIRDGELKPAIASMPDGLRQHEAEQLFPNEDPTLLGDRIAALTAAIGIPTCGGCELRKEWLNRAHAWLRGGKRT
jgi:hypothetical protein